MEYELYIDIFIMVNFTVNYILLLLVECLIKTGVRKWRIFVSSLLVACISLLLLQIRNWNYLIILISNYVVLTSLLINMGLKIKTKVLFFKAYISFVFLTICLGGILLVFENVIVFGSIFFFILICSYFFIYISLAFMKLLFHETKNIVPVDLYINGEKSSVRALYDTGNVLRDVSTGEPVSIVGGELSRRIMKVQNQENKIIPFQTISGDGEIKIVRIEKMCISYNNEKIWHKKPWIGVVDVEINGNKEYEMILNSHVI